MGFSCEIKQGNKSLTKDDTISYKLFGLGPSNSEETEAPYRVEDLRRIVCDCKYGDRLKLAAQDVFKVLQTMVRANLQSLKQCHCETCSCEEITPKGWSRLKCQRFLDIPAESITYLQGGY